MKRNATAPQTQHCKGEEISIADVLAALSLQAGLSSAEEQLQVWQIKAIFFICYHHYHQSTRVEIKAWRCLQDVQDYFNGGTLPRYVMCMYETGLSPIETNSREYVALLRAGSDGEYAYCPDGFHDRLISIGLAESMRRMI
jgi:hypothetical protein